MAAANGLKYQLTKGQICIYDENGFVKARRFRNRGDRKLIWSEFAEEIKRLNGKRTYYIVIKLDT